MRKEHYWRVNVSFNIKIDVRSKFDSVQIKIGCIHAKRSNLPFNIVLFLSHFNASDKMEIKNSKRTQLQKKKKSKMDESAILLEDNVLEIIRRKKREENIIHGMYTMVAPKRERERKKTIIKY